MTSFWEILKSSKNLKASDAFAELWGKSIADSWDIITLTGNLPLTFEAKGEALTNYLLHGSSEGAGVETENLMSLDIVQGAIAAATGIIEPNQSRVATNNFTLLNTGTYTLSSSVNIRTIGFLYSSASYKNYIDVLGGSVTWRYLPLTFTISSPTYIRFSFSKKDNALIKPSEITDLMLTPGSTAPATYIPPGYQIPLTNTSGQQSETYPLYIGSTKLGEDEYLDFAEQKVYKRTENLWNPQNIDTSKGYSIGYLYSDGRVEKLDSWRITEYIAVEPNTNYTLMWTANASPSATTPSIVEYDSAKAYLGGTAYSAHNVITITTHSDTRYVRFSVTNISWSNNVPRFNKGTNVVDLPYLQPTDPPVPFPEIATFEGGNTLSSTETVGEVSVTGKIKEI